MSQDPLIGLELRLDQLLEQTKPRVQSASSVQYALDRFSDLQKQGFMRSVRKTSSKTPAPVVACDDCLNWHPKGKHTADAATRRANRAANKAAAARIAAVRARIGGKLRRGRAAADRLRFRIQARQYGAWVDKGTVPSRDLAVEQARAHWTDARVLDPDGAVVWPAGGKARLAAGARGPRGGRTDIQALLFPLALGWTPATARAWARANGFNYGKVHTKGNHIRLRQADPGRYRRLRTICLKQRRGACEIKAVVGVR